ncbi:MAG: pseudouridine synthase family protein [Treponema sp.]
MLQYEKMIIGKDDSGRRLDRLMRIYLPQLPLSHLYAAIRKGLIRINGSKTTVHYKTVQGDMLAIADFLLDCRQKEPGAAELPCEKDNQQCDYTPDVPRCKGQKTRAFSILLHTPDLLIVNKASGMVVHGENSLQNLLVESLPHLRCAHGLAFRMGALHRLDKDTSGIICFSQSLRGAQWFSQCLREKSIKKYYIGIVEGHMLNRTIVTHEKGAALTHCTLLAYNPVQQVSCMLFALVTGRKHQIRKHARHIGHSLIGDTRYGSKRFLLTHKSYVLHAWRLYFPSNRLSQVPAYIEAECSASVRTLLDTLFPQWYACAARMVIAPERDSTLAVSCIS